MGCDAYVLVGYAAFPARHGLLSFMSGTMVYREQGALGHFGSDSTSSCPLAGYLSLFGLQYGSYWCSRGTPVCASI